MKLKILTVSLISLSLAACASQSVRNSQRAINEKVYAGYEQLVGRQSYAFDGEMRVKFDQLPSKSFAVNQTVQAEMDKLVQQKKLSATERQWLDEGLVANQQDKYNKVYLDNLETLSSRLYMSFDGVVDVGHGQFSINPKFGYASKNAQAWVAFPMAIDVKQAKFYADISALSPLITDSHYDGRYMVYDYAHYMKLFQEKNVDLKPFMFFFKEYLLLDPALSTAQDYQSQALTDIDKKNGGVQRIIYHTDYQTVVQQYLLYLYLNEPYLKSKLQAIGDYSQPNTSQEASEQNIESSLQASATPLSHAAQAKQRLEDAVNTLIDQSYSEDLSELQEHALDETDIEQTPAHADKQSVFDKLMFMDFGEDIDREKLLLSLKAFDQYRTGELITAKQVKKIVVEQPEAYDVLGQIVAELLQETLNIFYINNQITTDMVLDSHERIIRSDTSIKFLGSPDAGLGEITAFLKMNIHDYGKARVNTNALQQAVPIEKALNQQSKFFKKYNKLKKLSTSEDSTLSQNWSNEQRYANLARSLIAKKLSHFEIYHAVLWYAALLEDGGNLDAEQTKQLEQEVLLESLQHASESGWTLSTAQKQQLQLFTDHSHSKLYLSASTPYTVDSVLSPLFEDMDLQQSITTMYKQAKSTAQIFTRLYEKMDRQESDMSTSEPYTQFWLELFDILGQVAAQDLKSQKIDMQMLQKLDQEQLKNIDYEIYQQAYERLLKMD